MDLSTFAKDCLPEDIVRVYVGEGCDPYVLLSNGMAWNFRTQDSNGPYFDVPAPLLKYVCENFANKIEDARFARSHNPCKGSEPLQICIEENDFTAVNTMLYWMYFRKLPTVVGSNGLICAWALGDKYGIGQFTNLIMAEMLRVGHQEAFGLEVIHEAVAKTAAGSAMRRLMIDDLVYMERVWAEPLGEEISKLAVYEGFMEELNAAQDRFDQLGESVVDRLPSAERPFNEDWRALMVGGKGPEGDLVFDYGEMDWVAAEEDEQAVQ